ncbi:MAG: hypothetical protein U9R38_07465 [Candidatus Margulisiibacteriota bacterium]|nr:hypothetical protein [Candidatus Margulisiibacteriota bacterium]
MELLMNPHANKYFSKSGVLGARKHFTELADLLGQLSGMKNPKLELLHHKKIEIEGREAKEVLETAVAFIKAYARETYENVPSKPGDCPQPVTDVLNERDPEKLIIKFFSLSNGFVDIGRITDRLLINLEGVHCGFPQLAVKDFEGLYSILRAGHLLYKKETGSTLSAAQAKQPTSPPPEVDRAPVVSEYVDTVIRRTILPMIRYSKRNGTARYGDFVKDLLFSPQHPELKAAIEKAIANYNKIRTDGETAASFNTIIAELGKKYPEVKATNYYERAETFNQSVGQAQDIIAVWKPGHDTNELQRLVTNVLVLIKYPE